MKVISKKERHDLLSHVKKAKMGYEYLKANIDDQKKCLKMIELLEQSQSELEDLVGKLIEKG